MRPHQNVIEPGPNLVHPWRLIAWKESPLGNVQRDPGRAPSPRPIPLGDSRCRTVQAFSGSLQVNPCAHGEHQSHFVLPHDSPGSDDAPELSEERAQGRIGRSRKAIRP